MSPLQCSPRNRPTQKTAAIRNEEDLSIWIAVDGLGRWGRWLWLVLRGRRGAKGIFEGGGELEEREGVSLPVALFGRLEACVRRELCFHVEALCKVHGVGPRVGGRGEAQITGIRIAACTSRQRTEISDYHGSSHRTLTGIETPKSRMYGELLNLEERTGSFYSDGYDIMSGFRKMVFG
jgi:hypothetical protein